MKAKNLKSNKGILPVEPDGKSVIMVPVKPPVVPRGYEIERVDFVLKKVKAVNPNPEELLTKVPVAATKPLAKAVAKKVVAKKVEAKKKVVKKK